MPSSVGSSAPAACGASCADAGAGAAPQLDFGRLREGGAQRVEFLGEQRAQAGVLVAQVDEDFRDADRPGGDQHAFEEAVRLALQVPAVLEGARLALVDVHRHQARRGLIAHDAPLAPGRKARPAEAAQAGVLQRGDDLLGTAAAGDAVFVEPVAAAGAVARHAARAFRQRRLDGAGVDGVAHGMHIGLLDGILSDHRHRRALAAADAGHALDAHAVSQRLTYFRHELLGPGHGAGDGIAHPHRQRRRRLAGAHDVDVVVEGRDLVHLGARELHQLRQGGQAVRIDAAVRVLDAVQAFDQQVASRRGADEAADFFQHGGGDGSDMAAGHAGIVQDCPGFNNPARLRDNHHAAR